MEDQVPKMLQLRTLEYSHLGQVEREDPDDESSPVDGNPNSVGEAFHQLTSYKSHNDEKVSIF